jgi:hypothetical protein
VVAQLAADPIVIAQELEQELAGLGEKTDYPLISN